MTETFYAHGKLMLTGEYFVLDGAQALALPTKPGQHLSVTKAADGKSEIRWQSYRADKSLWIDAVLDIESLEVKVGHSGEADTLKQIFVAIKKYNPSVFDISSSYAFNTQLEFANDWGLGSSSTLIYCMAQWSKTNPYQILAETFGGSGYDIACASANGPIIFSRSNETGISVQPVTFAPVFSNELFFVHLGKKMNSREGIKQYRHVAKPKEDIVVQLNQITEAILNCQAIDAFETQLTEHERIISAYLQIDAVKDRHFKDFDGAVKSLGAWGGDFVLACAAGKSAAYTKNYFTDKGYKTILPYNEIIINA